MIDIPSQNDVSELFRILTGTLCQREGQEEGIPTTAKVVLEKNLTRGSVAIACHVVP